MNAPRSTGPHFGEPPTFHVHRCSPAEHPLHRLIGMRDPDHWYLYTLNGCLGDVTPFDTEAEARVAGEEFVAQALASQARSS